MAATSYVALLRGINVAGKKLLPMRQLEALFSDAGCREVRSYIQSGNVLFRAPASLARRLPQLLPAAIEERFHFQVPVVLRTAAELRAVAERNPWLASGVDPDSLHVVFLSSLPAAASVAGLDPRRSPPDEFRVAGREIYLRCPDGYGRSKLSNAWFDSRLSTTSTVRNWRTVKTLVEMTLSPDRGS